MFTIRINFQEGKEMLVETDRLVVVTVEQPLAMEAGLVDQPGQMNVSTQPLIWTAREQLAHALQARRSPANQRDVVGDAATSRKKAAEPLRSPGSIPPAPISSAR